MDLTEDGGEAEEARASKDEEKSRVETLVDLMEMISPLFRRTQKSLGCLEIRNLILKMKILVWCAKILLKLNNFRKAARKQCFLAVF